MSRTLGADYQVYYYLLNDTKTIIYISISPVNFIINSKCGKMALRHIILHTLVLEYPQVKLACLVLITNRIIHRYSYEALALILECTPDYYKKLESGYYAFEEKFSFPILAKKLNISLDDFITDIHFSPLKHLEKEPCTTIGQ